MSKIPILYKSLRKILKKPFLFYFNPKIINAKYLNIKGPLIIACNHRRFFDQFFIIASTKRYIRYMAKKEFFDNKLIAWFFKYSGCISVNRKEHDPNAKNKAISILKKGGTIGIFPEGTRNKTNKILLPFKYGTVSMAQKTNSYIVPVGIRGDYHFRSKNLIVEFGKPFKVTDKTLEEANKILYNEIEKLVKVRV